VVVEAAAVDALTQGESTVISQAAPFSARRQARANVVALDEARSRRGK
jgi:hypothetical protein